MRVALCSFGGQGLGSVQPVVLHKENNVGRVEEGPQDGAVSQVLTRGRL